MAAMAEDKRLRAPSALLMALELRAPLEYGASLAALPLLWATTGGDGHPVLVFPGLAASDMSTLPLRTFLSARGYDTYAWDQGRNLGPRPGVLEQCHRRVRELRAQTGRKVSLIGWSLGGIYARETAKTASSDVRCVVTLGTPFAGHPRATNAWRIYEMASGESVDARRDYHQIAEPPPVPTTSIYSRTDGVVAWQCSIQKETEKTENIEVEASHLGLGVNPMVLHAVADRLAQPEGQWQKFDRTGIRRLVYNNPDTSSVWSRLLSR
jgi:pimeloyl-ACP methyl ester carboxylesterase